MPTKTASAKTQLSHSTDKVKFTQSVSKTVYGRLAKAKTAKGMQYEQDVVRLAISNFLDQHGF